jgi:RNA polymerase sigma-70 factor (ECF subfamily)
VPRLIDDPRSDEELFRAAAEDVDAFSTLYQRHARLILGFCMRRLGDPELAADTTGEVFAIVLEVARTPRAKPRTFSPWLYTVARNKVTEAHRRGHAERRVRRRLGVERIVLTDEAIERIEAAVDTASIALELEGLPEEEREAIRARVVHDRDYAEIAEATGVSEAAIRQRVHRGLKRLRERIGSS